jgi:hypothetical protein
MPEIRIGTYFEEMGRIRSACDREEIKKAVSCETA